MICISTWEAAYATSSRVADKKLESLVNMARVSFKFSNVKLLNLAALLYRRCAVNEKIKFNCRSLASFFF